MQAHVMTWQRDVAGGAGARARRVKLTAEPWQALKAHALWSKRRWEKRKGIAAVRITRPMAALLLPAFASSLSNTSHFHASRLLPPLRLHRSHAAHLSAQLCILKESPSLPEQRAKSSVRLVAFTSGCLLQNALESRLPRLLVGAASGAWLRRWNCGLEASTRRGERGSHLL